MDAFFSFVCQAPPLTFQSDQLQCHLPNVHWQSIVAAEEEVLLLGQLILRSTFKTGWLGGLVMVGFCGSSARDCRSACPFNLSTEFTNQKIQRVQSVVIFVALSLFQEIFWLCDGCFFDNNHCKLKNKDSACPKHVIYPVSSSISHLQSSLHYRYRNQPFFQMTADKWFLGGKKLLNVTEWQPPVQTQK